MTTAQKRIFAAVAGIWLLAGGAWAQSSVPLNINAVVPGMCKFMSSSYTINFGTLDPSSFADTSAGVSMAYKCTNGTAPVSVKVNNQASGGSVNIVNAAHSLPVTLTWNLPTDPGLGFGPIASVIRMGITGTIPAAAVQTAFAGTYAGSYPITITP